MRPFPKEEIIKATENAKVIAVLEKDISFGNEGTVYTNVSSAIRDNNKTLLNYIGGLGGMDIKRSEIEDIFNDLLEVKNQGSVENNIRFIGVD